MQPQSHTHSTAKKSVNLTANTELVAYAKEKKINLSLLQKGLELLAEPRIASVATVFHEKLAYRGI